MEKTELSLTEEQLGKYRLDLEKIKTAQGQVRESVEQVERQQEQLDIQKVQLNNQRSAALGAIKSCETILAGIKKSQALAKITKEKDETPEGEPTAVENEKVEAEPSGEPAKKKEGDEDEDN